ncbi:MAG: hypothetical protein SNJ75_19735, partial [Gemmataceae bacterium]
SPPSLPESPQRPPLLKRWSRSAFRTFLFSFLSGLVLFGLVLFGHAFVFDEVGIKSEPLMVVTIVAMWIAFVLAVLSVLTWMLLLVVRLGLALGRGLGLVSESAADRLS